MRVSLPVKQLMRTVSDLVSRDVERLSTVHQLYAKKLVRPVPSCHANLQLTSQISTVSMQQNPIGYAASEEHDLLHIFQADSGLLAVGDTCKLLCDAGQGSSMLAIAEYLRLMKIEYVLLLGQSSGLI
jgi:hypothetical protein